ncbi:hypothetical protein P0W64_19160 [Tsukamurella sp. 8F]|uniref:hypothetical protein n=1 Tax=unclassified Tsukamurella TaxID=2633480 RepID=UPI0023B99F48|nr:MULTISPECIES: hypothetical protein [unclassified Tsukamurella]MDF0532503.1 hypothetical protein [Tsukamurella sp. 8J]MDF0588905.1 hypothetical protein [Tsukamurella sp. 8F]
MRHRADLAQYVGRTDISAVAFVRVRNIVDLGVPFRGTYIEQGRPAPTDCDGIGVPNAVAEAQLTGKNGRVAEYAKVCSALPRNKPMDVNVVRALSEALAESRISEGYREWLTTAVSQALPGDDGLAKVYSDNKGSWVDQMTLVELLSLIGTPYYPSWIRDSVYEYERKDDPNEPNDLIDRLVFAICVKVGAQCPAVTAKVAGSLAADDLRKFSENEIEPWLVTSRVNRMLGKPAPILADEVANGLVSDPYARVDVVYELSRGPQKEVLKAPKMIDRLAAATIAAIDRGDLLSTAEFVGVQENLGVRIPANVAKRVSELLGRLRDEQSSLPLMFSSLAPVGGRSKPRDWAHSLDNTMAGLRLKNYRYL